MAKILTKDGLVHCPGGKIEIQGDQLNMTCLSDLSSVPYCTRVHWTSHFLRGTRKTRPCLTGHPVVSLVESDEGDR